MRNVKKRYVGYRGHALCVSSDETKRPIYRAFRIAGNYKTPETLLAAVAAQIESECGLIAVKLYDNEKVCITYEMRHEDFLKQASIASVEIIKEEN